jgi:hypothetical protein
MRWVLVMEGPWVSGGPTFTRCAALAVGSARFLIMMSCGFVRGLGFACAEASGVPGMGTNRDGFVHLSSIICDQVQTASDMPSFRVEVMYFAAAATGDADSSPSDTDVNAVRQNQGAPGKFPQGTTVSPRSAASGTSVHRRRGHPCRASRPARHGLATVIRVGHQSMTSGWAGGTGAGGTRARFVRSSRGQTPKQCLPFEASADRGICVRAAIVHCSSVSEAFARVVLTLVFVMRPRARLARVVCRAACYSGF